MQNSMRVLGISVVFLLSLCLMTYGFTGVSFAQTDQPPLSVDTDQDIYAENSKITVSGEVKDSSLKKNPTPVIVQIIGPTGNIVGVAQEMLDSNNAYSASFQAAGPYYKSAGEYVVVAKYDAQKATTTFEFIGPSASQAPPPPSIPEQPQCGPGTVLQGDMCVIEEPQVMVAEPEPVVVEVAEPEPEPELMCGEGTVMQDGKCVAEEKGGGCLIATAAYGSEMAPQVQFLRELRDNTVLQTHSGTSFMTGFNQFYYSFSPAVADYERENPVFREAVKLTLTPLLTSLTLLNYVDIDTEEEMLGYGIGVILLNIGMYFVAPAAVIIAIKNRRK